jgi:hypothetical protein
MALKISDLQPEPFTVTLGEQTTECAPLKLRHIFILNKLGTVFQNPNDTTREQIVEAEADFYYVLADLIPELKDVSLPIDVMMDLIAQMMMTVSPSENQELANKGVSFDANPKASKNENNKKRTG